MNKEDSFEFFEKQSLNISALFNEIVDTALFENDQNLAELNDQNLVEMVDTALFKSNNQNLNEIVNTPTVGQIFDQNIIIVLAEVINMRVNTKAIRASCPKTTDILSLSSLFLNHNNHPIKNITNKFAVKYRAFSEDMLKDIKFWTEIGNLNMRTQSQMLMKWYPDTFFLPQDLSNAIQTYKQQNRVEYETATLLNQLLERKSEDNRWHDLYIQYQDVIQHNNTYSTNRFKIVLGFFVIVDNNNRSRLVEQALISDETTESYKWVLQTLITNTGVIPLTIITDNDLAINTAIANVLPNSVRIQDNESKTISSCSSSDDDFVE
ncbi:9809_t:CDS:2, partial [Dentiscutata erythropus]